MKMYSKKRALKLKAKKIPHEFDGEIPVPSSTTTQNRPRTLEAPTDFKPALEKKGLVVNFAMTTAFGCIPVAGNLVYVYHVGSLYPAYVHRRGEGQTRDYLLVEFFADPKEVKPVWVQTKDVFPTRKAATDAHSSLISFAETKKYWKDKSASLERLARCRIRSNNQMEMDRRVQHDEQVRSGRKFNVDEFLEVDDDVPEDPPEQQPENEDAPESELEEEERLVISQRRQRNLKKQLLNLRHVPEIAVDHFDIDTRLSVWNDQRTQFGVRNFIDELMFMYIEQEYDAYEEELDRRVRRSAKETLFSSASFLTVLAKTLDSLMKDPHLRNKTVYRISKLSLLAPSVEECKLINKNLSKFANMGRVGGKMTKREKKAKNRRKQRGAEDEEENEHFPCCICRQPFTNRAALDDHLKRSHARGVITIDCDLPMPTDPKTGISPGPCTFRTVRKGRLRTHQILVHEKDLSPLRPTKNYKGKKPKKKGLDDIRGALGGRTSFKGAQLGNDLEIIGSDLKLESEKPSKTDKICEKPPKKDASKAEPKKSRLSNEADSSQDADLETKKKKLEDEQFSLKTLSTLKAASSYSLALTSELRKPRVKTILQTSILKFARSKNLLGKVTNKLDELSPKGEEQTSEPSKTVDTHTEDDKSKKVEPKSVKSDASDEDEPLKAKKMSKVKSKDSNDDESDKENSSRPKRKPGPKQRKSKQRSSNDYSDLEVNASPVKKRKLTTSTANSGNDGKKKNAKLGRGRESLRESPRKSPARRNSNESKSSSRKGMNREDSPTSKTSNRKVKDSDGDEGSVKSHVKIFSSAPPLPCPKPKVNPPGPKIAKMRLAQKKQGEDESKMDVDDDDTGNVKNETIQNKLFADSDSEDSEILKIKQKFPLDLQDAVGKILAAAYKPDSTTEPSSKLHKFKQGAKQISSKVYQVGSGMQQKLEAKGWELAPYTGSISASDDVFTRGKYYVVGQGSKEKLVMFDESSELQELVFTDSDIEELLE